MAKSWSDSGTSSTEVDVKQCLAIPLLQNIVALKLYKNNHLFSIPFDILLYFYSVLE